MNTPIFDFVQQYIDSSTSRFHMPGHKGQSILGCESWDITEIKGADALYEADGIIAQSEANATALFGSEKTLYSTEGSSQCIRAMLYLAVMHHRQHFGHKSRPVIVAARNVHKAFVYAAALLDLEVVWLWPEKTDSLCGCPISAHQLEETLAELGTPPAAVYLTSPDYLGGMADIPSLSEICHGHNTLLLIDNAHGAYLRFLKPSCHPLDLGADMCCDSAHKTLPVLTGGAYLHIAKSNFAISSKHSSAVTSEDSCVSSYLAAHAKSSLALFGSTSPSYLTLLSLDRCNGLLADDYPAQLAYMCACMDQLKETLADNGWHVVSSDPLRLTLRAPLGMTGSDLAEYLRTHHMECEFADEDFLVLMLTPKNTKEELAALMEVLTNMPMDDPSSIGGSASSLNITLSQPGTSLPQARGDRLLSIREAMFSPHQLIPVEESLGQICGTPTVSCPPAIPIVVSGERITKEALALFRHYGVDLVDVVIS